ncbi:hypothetical protein OSB04_004126, partial [Centaurea solstitialis]
MVQVPDIDPTGKRHHGQATGFWAYAFQIIFQMVAAAIMLTNCIYWFILLPLDARSNYNAFSIACILSAIPFVSNRIFLSLDMHLCHFPVDIPCMHQDLVPTGGFVACFSLWNFYSSYKIKELCLVEEWCLGVPFPCGCGFESPHGLWCRLWSRLV